MKSYLVTGGAGFIGSTLCEKLLKDGHKVVCIDNFNDFYNPEIKRSNIKSSLQNINFKLEKIDIRDEKEMERVFSENKFDTIIHLAAMAGVRPSIENPLLYQQVNCEGSQVLFEQIRINNIKNLVFASSSSVYGNNENVPFKETDVVDNAISPYAATKKANEVMGHVYHSLYKINIAFLRFFTVYGPRQRPDLAINKFTRLVSNAEEIPMYGDGSTSRDYTYIDDIIDGIIKTITWVEKNDNVYEIFNLGGSEPIKLINMIKSIERATGQTAKIKYLPMQSGDVNQTYADITKAKEVLGYNPLTSFDNGIKKFVEWYEKEKKVK